MRTFVPVLFRYWQHSLSPCLSVCASFDPPPSFCTCLLIGCLLVLLNPLFRLCPCVFPCCAVAVVFPIPVHAVLCVCFLSYRMAASPYFSRYLYYLCSISCATCKPICPSLFSLLFLLACLPNYGAPILTNGNASSAFCSQRLERLLGVSGPNSKKKRAKLEREIEVEDGMGDDFGAFLSDLDRIADVSVVCIYVRAYLLQAGRLIVANIILEKGKV